MPGLVAAAPAMEPVDPSLYIDKLDAHVRHEKNVVRENMKRIVLVT
jgi:hypothetical protein